VPPPPPLKQVGSAVSVKESELESPSLLSSMIEPFSSFLVTVRNTGTVVSAEVLLMMVVSWSQRNGTTFPEKSVVVVPGDPNFCPVSLMWSPGHPAFGVAFSSLGGLPPPSANAA